MTSSNNENSDTNTLEKEIILENFSFYEWMNFEKLFIGLSDADLAIVELVDLGELDLILDELLKEGHLEEKLENKERFFKRTLKKKTLISKIKSKLL